MKKTNNLNYLAIIAGALAAFIVGAVWYSPLLWGNEYMSLRGISPGAMKEMRPQVSEVIGELVRNLVIAYVLARFILQQEVFNAKSAVRTGFWIWIGFQAMLLVGAVLHENMPLHLYFIHAGDALVKTLIMSVIIGIWQRKQTIKSTI